MIASTPRPRALHNLDLRPGDVVRLVKWQDGRTTLCGNVYTVNAAVNVLEGSTPLNRMLIPSNAPKGRRPLFVIVSRKIFCNA